MISCEEFIKILEQYNLTFFTGIPDSTFKDLMKFLTDNPNDRLENIVACNECEAIAIASGYHLATNKIGIVYMQNSGFGKTVNPLTSLCDPEVYSIPILLMIGWRGEPNKIDAPQHKKMGIITLPLLDTLQIPYEVLEPTLQEVNKALNQALDYFTNKKGPYALIFRRDFFQNYKMKKTLTNNYHLTAKEVIQIILDSFSNNEIFVSTTGYISRRIFEYRELNKKDHNKSFYNIGSMGCASSIGLSIALQKRKNRVIVFDGDGAAIMQMGAFSTIGKYSPSNLIHIIIDNEAHESTGGQPTNSKNIKLEDVAQASNYKWSTTIYTKKELIKVLEHIHNQNGPIVIVIKTSLHSESELKRPDKSPKDYKENFMKYLSNLD
ncbi:MAG: phosphonopyruvate decarboxylase [Candidatus Odinarchaeota archaeon]